MNAKRLEQWLANMTPVGPAPLVHRTSALRGAGLIPRGARGRNAPDVSLDVAANVLMSMAAATAAEAPSAVITYSAMVEKDGSFLGCPFGEAFKDILQHPDNKYEIKEVRICQSWPMATIIRKNGDATRYGPLDQPAEGFGKAGGYLEMVFRISILCQLGLDLSHKTESGWTGEHPEVKENILRAIEEAED